MTPTRLAWWSRVLRVKVPIRDASDLRWRLFASFMLIALPLVVAALVVFGIAIFASLANDCGTAYVNQSPLEARVHRLETQVAAMRDGGSR